MARADSHNLSVAGVHPIDIAAASVLNDRSLKIANHAKHWRLGFFGLLVVAGGLAGGLVSVVRHQHVIPYIVEVNEAGSARAVAELRTRTVEDPVVIQALLRTWLQDLCALTTDTEATHRRTQEASAMALEPAQHVMASDYHDTPPEEVLQRGRSVPMKITLQPLAGHTWRARWVEQLVDHDGHVTKEHNGEGLIEIVHVPPKT